MRILRKKLKTFKVHVPVVSLDCGDGSSYSIECKSDEDAEAIDTWECEQGNGTNENSTTLTIEIDENGKLLSGITFEEYKKELG